MKTSRMVAAAAAFGVAVVALVGLLYRPSTDPGEVRVDLPDPAPRDVPAAPAPAPQAAPPKLTRRPRTGMMREHPYGHPEVHQKEVPIDVRVDFNHAMQDAVREAREQCVQPWLDETGGEPATFVMDAVVTDGEVTDISLRAVGEVPKEVVDCARDAGWTADWPSWEATGELRFQETFTASPSAP